jgi:CubicO group peptidase (beta-lactamase class C family)
VPESTVYGFVPIASWADIPQAESQPYDFTSACSSCDCGAQFVDNDDGTVTTCEENFFPPPVPTPQNSYLIDTLQGSDSGTTRLNQEMLDSLVSNINMGLYDKIHSLVIIHNDKLVFEEYSSGWERDMLHPIYSGTKSVTSALIGIAISQGHITGVDTKLLDFFPEYDSFDNNNESKESITLEHVLTMSAGFEWDEITVPHFDNYGNLNLENSYGAMTQSDDWIKFVLDLPMVSEPGSELVYNSGGSQLLSGILTNTTGLTAEAFAESNLFPHLGITKWEWVENITPEHIIGNPQGHSNTAAGLFLHPVNMAMFGYLYLNHGKLGNVQVVPESWVETSVFNHIPFANLDPVADKYYNYGYQWWLISNEFPYPFLDNIGDIYYASGFGGQLIMVMPDIDMVIAVTAADDSPNPDSFKAIFKGILPALEHID